MQIVMSLCLAVLFACAPARAQGAVAAAAPAAPAVDPARPTVAQRSNPVTYQVDLRAVVTPPAKTKKLRVWMPVPPSDDVQTVSGSRFETWPLTATPAIATEPVYGNTFAYFEFSNPEGAQQIRHTFTVTTPELRYDLDPAKVQPVKAWPASFAPYLRSEGQAVVISDRVRSLAQQLVPAPANQAADLGQVIDWISTNLVYGHETASLQASSENALEQKGGHCSDYHGLCSALSRSLGYPARVVYGINPMPRNSPSHCKAEVFLPPYGWVSFDLSETQKLCRKIADDPRLPAEDKAALIAAAKQRLMTGFRDNTWFKQTHGTDYDLVPAASRKVAVVRTVVVEADGVLLPEPDPGDPHNHEFTWMTLHDYVPDRPVTYPFTDVASLRAPAGSAVPADAAEQPKGTR
jgi:transglutaminase-like putative cysteine protease